MAAPKGNQFWKNIDPDNLGRPPKWKTPTALWEAIQPYFKECDDNPLESIETKVNKSTETRTIKHKIPYTWEGLYVFLTVCDLDHYKTKQEFSAILTHVKHIIYNQKFTGAAAGLFNQAIIARDLGLTEKTDITSGGDKIGPDYTDKQRARIEELEEMAIKKAIEKLKN